MGCLSYFRHANKPAECDIDIHYARRQNTAREIPNAGQPRYSCSRFVRTNGGKTTEKNKIRALYDKGFDYTTFDDITISTATTEASIWHSQTNAILYNCTNCIKTKKILYDTYFMSRKKNCSSFRVKSQARTVKQNDTGTISCKAKAQGLDLKDRANNSNSTNLRIIYRKRQ